MADMASSSFLKRNASQQRRIKHPGYEAGTGSFAEHSAASSNRPAPGLASIGFATWVRAGGWLQLAQTGDEGPNLVWQLLLQHVFRRDPQDGSELFEEMRIKKSVHGRYLTIGPTVRRQRSSASVIARAMRKSTY